ncbi:MAG: FAD-dependent 5-carboxymethylaminomethyl-2-thiouridine(34) oxidoreductase MnmC [Alphaproteobacteria bacterium]|nr:FAD-dependent 5-carboxymethylaminomethyl-2-thiouridine(34) oxidoreductase MnmC [Alphaproteobacteria bacterium]
MTQPLYPAQIDWNEQGLPISRHYGDVYFSSEGGLDEARHVFLAGNNIEHRLAHEPVFTVGEIGFGSGLNFLALWQMWEKIAPVNARLCFFSVEKHPLQLEDMARIHALFPELLPYSKALCNALPLQVPGYHRIYLANNRIQLTLMYGDALDMLQQQDAKADAWFLDGFAPRLNVELWSNAMTEQVCRLSASGASLATFSTASSTCDALSAAGFALSKRAGFGRKKYMLTGIAPQKDSDAKKQPPPKSVTVIGAGLAGASLAHALAKRGCNVVVKEKHQPAQGASGNPSAIFYPGVTVGWQPLSQLYYMGFSHSLAILRDLSTKHTIAHEQCGMILFPKPQEVKERHPKILATMQPHRDIFYGVSAKEASALTGLPMPELGLYFPAAGWVHLGQLTHALLEQPQITIEAGSAVDVLPHYSTNEPVILCNGWQAADLYPALKDSMHIVGGQITSLTKSTVLSKLRCVVSYGGYATPAIAGQYHLGATYEKMVDTAEITPEGHARNINKLTAFLQEMMPDPPSTQSIPPNTIQGWAALRTATPNRTPLLGKLDEGLYASLAHGSRGLLSCGLFGEHIASVIYGEPLPIPRDIVKVLAVDRYMHKA